MRFAVSVVWALTPLACVLLAQRNPKWANSISSVLLGSILAFGCLIVFIFWRLALFCRFSLKGLLLATISLNACLSLIIVPKSANWQIFGGVLLFIWFTVVGVSLLHSGVAAHFESVEKRELETLLRETKSEPKP